MKYLYHRGQLEPQLQISQSEPNKCLWNIVASSVLVHLLPTHRIIVIIST